ncbi:hypothetical protein BH11PLA1_BH11PLA1_00230 [soil metagenome]
MNYAKVLCLLAGAMVSSSAFAVETATISKDELRAAIAELQADAEGRTSLLQGGATAGYDSGGNHKFFVASSDNKFRLNVSGFAQLRYTFNIRDQDGVPGTGVGGGGFPDTSYVSNFSMRNIAVRFDGHVVNPNLLYNIRIRTVDGSGLFVDDAFITYNMNDGLYIKGGQFKSAFSRENLMADEYVMGADRSIQELFFSSGRSEGVEFGWKNEAWWVAGTFHDGFNTANSGFLGAGFGTFSGAGAPFVGAAGATAGIFPLFGQAAYAVGGRVDWTFDGNREMLADMTSRPGDKSAGALGAAVEWQQSRHGQTSTFAPVGATNTDRDALNFTFDGQWKQSGWSVMGAVNGSVLMTKNTTALVADDNQDSVNLGFMLQGAYRFTNESEVFARYDGILLDEDLGNQAFAPAVGGDNSISNNYYNFITFGYNHYFADHAAKFTLDCVLSLNQTSPFVGAENPTLTNIAGGGAAIGGFSGLVGSSKGLEAAVRAQFQIMF